MLRSGMNGLILSKNDTKLKRWEHIHQRREEGNYNNIKQN